MIISEWSLDNEKMFEKKWYWNQHSLVRVNVSYAHTNTHHTHTPGIAIAAPLVVGLMVRLIFRAISCVRPLDWRVIWWWTFDTRQEYRCAAKGDAFKSLTPPRKTDADAVLAIHNTENKITVIFSFFTGNIMALNLTLIFLFENIDYGLVSLPLSRSFLSGIADFGFHIGSSISSVRSSSLSLSSSTSITLDPWRVNLIPNT